VKQGASLINSDLFIVLHILAVNHAELSLGSQDVSRVKFLRSQVQSNVLEFN